MKPIIPAIVLSVLLSSAPVLAIEQPVTPPPGFVAFCAAHPGECAERGPVPALTRLTDTRLAELRRVQADVNGRILWMPDSATFGEMDRWEYPFAWGDCEDIALAKRRALVALGWPRRNLPMATARLADGRLHVILLALTSGGVFVLDNRLSGLATTSAYRLLARQSRADESVWVGISGGSHR